MSGSYFNIITMTQPENEAPTVFVLRVEAQCDQLDGLFVFINGISEIIRSHVRALDGQFQDRTLADTISAAQMSWEGTNKLRQSLKPPRTQLSKVSYASPMPTRPVNVDRPFPVTQPPARSRSPLPPGRTDICYNCNKPGHFSAQCAEPYRPRERRPAATQAVRAVANYDALSAEESSDSKNEYAGSPVLGRPAP